MTTSLISELLDDIKSAGLRVWAESSKLRVHPRVKLTDELTERIRAHRDELLDEIEGSQAPQIDTPDGTQWDWWDCLEPEDFAQLTRPQQRTGRCAYCGGITTHSRTCHELRASWQVMRWGKYKGQHVSAVSEDYLEFALSRRFGTGDDRAVFLDELRRRQPKKYGTSAWSAMVIEAPETKHEQQED